MIWEIRRATRGDASELSAIALAAKRHWGYPEAWIEAWRDELTVSHSLIEKEPVFVAVGSQSELVGFYLLSHVNTGAEMEHFWVRPEAMGRGVGRTLFEHAVAQARAAGCHALHIDADPHAAGFYERMGATLVGKVSASMDGRPRVRPQYKINLRVPESSRATFFSSSRERRLWIWTLVVVVTIFSTLGLASTMVGRLVERGLFDGTFILAFFLIWVAIVTHGLRVRPGGIEITVAIGVAAVYLMVIARLGIPERSHLFEYGVVALLIYESLAERASRGRRVPAPALLAIVATSSIGAVDECIQAIMPSRVFAWLDMLFNVIAAVMAVGASAALSWARRTASRLRHRWPLIALLALTPCASTNATAQTDPASPKHPLHDLAFLEGSWTGTIDGTLGPATGQRDYRFIVGDRFLLMRHDRNPDDSVPVADRYDEWTIFSFDEERDVIALREFLIEGMVNTYTCELDSEPKVLTCESEFTEGDARFRLRLQLTFANSDSITEVFEIYRPDGALGVQMEGQWRRAGKAD